MIVIDASAVLEVVLRTPLGAAIEARTLTAGEPLHAPYLLDVEIVQVIRRFTLTGEIEAERAQAALDDFLDFPIWRHAHSFLLPRLWALRHNFTAYDAAYVALAEVLDVTLLTHDRRLAASARRHVSVELL